MTNDPHIAAAPLPTTEAPAPKGAGVGIRAVATIIDGIVLVAIVVLFFEVWGQDGACESGVNLSYNVGDDVTSVCGGPAALYILVLVGYWVALEALLGATVGKLLTGLRVVRADGVTRVGWGGAIIRTVLRVIDGLLFYLVAAIAVWSSASNQRIGDMAAKTLVVRR